MSIIGLYPRHDPVFQEYYIRQFILAKNRVAHFPETNELLDNFAGYENLFWKESRNKVFLISTIRPHRSFITKEFLIANGLDMKNKDQGIESPLIDLNEDPSYPELLITLENGIKNLVKGKLNSKNFTELKQRLSDYDYYVSNSVFSEIFIASKIGKKLGYDNIVLSPSLPSGKAGDIKVILNGKEIYLELTTTTNSLAEIKLQRIFDDFAEFLGTLDSDKSYIISIAINTSRLPQDQEGNIDEESSKSFLKEWTERLFFRNLIDCNLSLNLNYEFHGLKNEEYLSDIVSSQQEIDSSFKTILENETNLNWARNVRIQNLNQCPFEHISCKADSSEISIHVEGNNAFPSEVGLLEEKSFFGKISRSIRTKIKENQFESEKPAIILLQTNFWANWFEDDDADFQKIKRVIQAEFSNTNIITGILIYKNDFRHGRYIENEKCLPSIVLTEEEINYLFSNNLF